ncbi:LOW QUALITY PROTEIN: F-box protein At2g17036-like [Coffea eugenioides]|uniref:LOW QUALITY PROTEIN: F-box protein At2g17036-like n=1 Tax=Coffea eugenioides TaxID=49369 RepID=UPI000F613FDC|nr:LOW QUALITY PROTEIN: F-box protein At2g17036-like [Coffea eugenioides]
MNKSFPIIELLPDLLALISRRLDLIEDFVAFRGVCTSWRVAARKQIFHQLVPTVPLLMLAEKEDRDEWEFYSLSRCKIWRNLSVPKTKNKKCMESRGWLITVGIAGEMNLLHPFSVLSASPPSSPDKWLDFVLMVVYNGGAYLEFWRSGDKSWTGVEKQDGGAFSDVNFYYGKFYAIAHNGHIYIFWEPYLVEMPGDLVVVARDGTSLDDDDNYRATDFLVIQLDLTNRKWNEITSLGDRSIFLGYNAAFSVEAAGFPGIIRPSCIYFTDDCIESYHCSEQEGGKDMGIYNLENGKIERFDDIQSFSSISPPVWVALSF